MGTDVKIKIKFIILIITIAMIEITVQSKPNRFDKGVDGILIKKELISKKVNNIPLECPADVVGTLCGEDCQTLMACQGIAEPLFKKPCSEISSGTPYCTPGTTGCTNRVDHNSPQCIAAQPPTFTCTCYGYIPDPSDCTRYHKCTGEFHEIYQCPVDHVFDINTKKCKSKRRFKGCFPIDCTKSIHQYVPYGGHKSYYAYCDYHETIMYKCDDSNNFEFNPKSEKCEYNCKSVGLFPDHRNCHQYYECFKPKKCSDRSIKRLKSRRYTCPPHTIFDAWHQRCVKGECTENTTPFPDDVTIMDTTTLAPQTTDTTTTPSPGLPAAD